MRSLTRAEPCRPAGSLDWRPPARSFCMFCHAVLTPTPVPPQRRGRLDDWQEVDGEGRITVYVGPPGYLEDPAGWWADLAKNHIGVYSNLRAQMDLGGNPFWHHHVPGPSAEARVQVDPPYCCSQPMYGGVDGWYCRTSRRLFPYTNQPSAKGGAR